MKTNAIVDLSLGAALVRHSAASFGPWVPGQINTSICTWSQPRANIIRDMIYLDGGDIYWSAGMDSGTYGPPISYGNPGGIILTYNLSEPYSASSNLTTLLLMQSLSTATGGQQSDPGPVNYDDGGMLANYESFYLYGGVPFVLSYSNVPAADKVLGYNAYQTGPFKALFSPGFFNDRLPAGITRYIAYGAAVSAPSENKAWYISGMTSPTRGPIYDVPDANLSNFAQNLSNTLIRLDIESANLTEMWANYTLPNSIHPRANPEAVWVPVGDQGIVVLLGGVVDPEWASPFYISPNATTSEDVSPQFMQSIGIYDVASDTWYSQPTQNGPGTRTRGCAVVAYASDRSSFNIYYYGGFNGVYANETASFYDDVWVLSLPSFTWTQLNNGTRIHARAGHKCFSPYPDQMMAFGGYTALTGDTMTMTCLDGGALVLFNLTSGEWLDSYDPTTYADYGVPAKVRSAIGGSESGGATMTQPAGGFATTALGQVFATSYNMTKINKYWPYAPAPSSSLPNGTRPNLPTKKRASSLPSWAAPVLGVLLGLFVLTVTLAGFCFWRRSWIPKQRSRTSSSEEAGRSIWNWMMRSQPPEKTPTVTSTEEVPSLSWIHGIAAGHPSSMSPTPQTVCTGSPPNAALEAPDSNMIFELPANSPTSELHGNASPRPELDGKASPTAELDGSTPNDGAQLSGVSSSKAGDVSSSASRSTFGARSTPSPAPGLARSDSGVMSSRFRFSAPGEHGSFIPGSPSLSSSSDGEGRRAGQARRDTFSSVGMHHEERPSLKQRTQSEISGSTTSPVSPPTGGEATPPDDYFGMSGDLVSPIQRYEDRDVDGRDGED